MNKQSFIGVTISLMLLISNMVFTQNKKETAQKQGNTSGSGFITQRDTSLIADNSKQSFGQQSIIFLNNSDKYIHNKFLKNNDNAFVFLKSAVDSTPADSVNASQSGEYNRIYIYNLPDKNSTLRHFGSGNSVLYIQIPDSSKATKPKTEIRQSGNSNRTVIIQN